MLLRLTSVHSIASILTGNSGITALMFKLSCYALSFGHWKAETFLSPCRQLLALDILLVKNDDFLRLLVVAFQDRASSVLAGQPTKKM